MNEDINLEALVVAHCEFICETCRLVHWAPAGLGCRDDD